MISQYAPLAARFVANLPRPPSAAELGDLDEAELIAQSRLGSADAYGVLVRKYQHRLCTALFHACGSLTDAQDAAQEAFLRAFLKLETYNGASSFYTWLHRIALNAVISEHRKRKTRSTTEHSRSLRLDDVSAKSECPDERMLRAERVKQVQAALSHISAEHRMILVLREIDDCDYHEIAHLLALPIGTVRSRLHRARLELKRELDRAPIDDE